MIGSWVDNNPIPLVKVKAPVLTGSAPEEGCPSGEGVAGTDTGPADSVAMDSLSLAAATFDSTGVS